MRSGDDSTGSSVAHDAPLRTAVAERFARVLGGRTPALTEQRAPAQDDPIDVRRYLLHPPPEPRSAASERRALLVRRGSLAVCAVVAIVLVLPLPGRGGASSPGSAPDVEEAGPVAAANGTEPAPQHHAEAPASAPRRARLPRRIDSPPRARVSAPRRTGPPRSRGETRSGARSGSMSTPPQTTSAPVARPARSPTSARPVPPAASATTPAPDRAASADAGGPPLLPIS